MQEAANDTNMNEHQMGVMAIFGGIMEGQSQGGVSQGASLFRVEGRSKSLAQTGEAPEAPSEAPGRLGNASVRGRPSVRGGASSRT